MNGKETIRINPFQACHVQEEEEPGLDLHQGGQDKEHAEGWCIKADGVDKLVEKVRE